MAFASPASCRSAPATASATGTTSACATGEILPLMQDLGSEAAGCRVDPAAVALAAGLDAQLPPALEAIEDLVAYDRLRRSAPVRRRNRPERRIVAGLEAGVCEAQRPLLQMIEELLPGGGAADVMGLPPGRELGPTLPEAIQEGVRRCFLAEDAQPGCRGAKARSQ